MTAQAHSWENILLAWAYEALESAIPVDSVAADSVILQRAYDHCESLTRTHSRTFFLASSLLPFAKRRAARALYAFCRVTDNIVDSSTSDSEARAALSAWKRAVMSPQQSSDPVVLAWSDTRARFNIPLGYAEQLIDGVACDLTKKRYATFAELAEYSYGVASTVGLMAMHIIGFDSEKALPYAVKLGVALQLTNILRDVAEDYRRGRIYLPMDELDAFGLSESDIAAGTVDDRWRAFMRFQIARNRKLYNDSLPGIALLNPDGRFAIAAAGELYQAILADIEAHGSDVFARRARVSVTGKLRRLPGIWWRSRQFATAWASPGSVN
ncbi:MAG: phytoene/squalene synthase family protein [Aggregatilineales bacterium]